MVREQNEASERKSGGKNRIPQLEKRRSSGWRATMKKRREESGGCGLHTHRPEYQLASACSFAR